MLGKGSGMRKHFWYAQASCSTPMLRESNFIKHSVEKMIQILRQNPQAQRDQFHSGFRYENGPGIALGGRWLRELILLRVLLRKWTRFSLSRPQA